MITVSPSEIEELFDAYKSTQSLRKKSKGFIKLVEASPYKYQFRDKTLKAFATLKNCGDTYYRRMPDGTLKDYIYQCHQPICHKCESYDRLQYAYDALDEVRKHFPRSELIGCQLSSVTINFSKSELGSDLTGQSKEAKSSMNTLLKRVLPDVAFIGGFQNAMQPGTGQNSYNGMFHAHFVAIHPTIDRSQLTSALNKKYPGKNQICVNAFDEDELDFSVCVYLYYSADLTTKINSPGKDQFSPREIPEVYARYLNSLESIRSGKRRGWTFELGHERLLKSQKEKWQIEQDMKLAVLRERLAKRHLSINTDYEHDQHESLHEDHKCPQFECIHKQLRDEDNSSQITNSGSSQQTRHHPTHASVHLHQHLLRLNDDFFYQVGRFFLRLWRYLVMVPIWFPRRE